MVPVRAPKAYSILLADDQTLTREGLAALCRMLQDYRVTDQCADGAAALRMILAKQPDIAILDLALTGLSALEILHKLGEAKSSTRILVLSAFNDRKTVIDALRAGANAFLLKSAPAYHLLEAFKQILNGGVYVSTSLGLDKIFNCGRPFDQARPLESLSAREYQVFCLLVEGIRAKEIGARLGLHPKTIDTYRVNLMRKLDIHSIAGLVRFAVQGELTSTVPPRSAPQS